MSCISQVVFLFSALTTAIATSSSCPPLDTGSFTVKQQDLYPESADWDPVHCKLYISSLYNCSLVTYDPYSQTTEVIEIPGITNHGEFNFTDYHLSGIDFDQHTGDVFLTLGAATAFTSTMTDTSDANFTGPNRVVQYSTRTGTIVGNFDMKPAQKQYLAEVGHRTSGYQDTATDCFGNTYAIGTFGNSITKISAAGEVTLWYAPPTYSKQYGFAGIAVANDSLLVGDTLTAGFYVFDTTKDAADAVLVQPQDVPRSYQMLMGDGLYVPRKYAGNIALWSDDYNGTAIYASEDSWGTAQWVGLVGHPGGAAPDGGLVTGTFEMGDRVFSVYEFFQTDLPQKPREDWEFYDITEAVEELVRQSGIAI